MEKWQIETNFGNGWEIESTYDNQKDAERDYAEYQVYARGYHGMCRLRKITERSE